MSGKENMNKASGMFKSLGTFLRDCRAEFGKISWPGRKELVESTWAVAAMILLLSVFVLVCDQVVTGVIRFLTSLRG